MKYRADVMNGRESYFYALAKRLLSWCEKPSAILVVMAFLLLWTFTGVIAGIPLIAHVIVNAAISIVTLLMVMLLQNAHRQDVRALQARIEELAAERQAVGSASSDMLTDAEVRQVRDLLRCSGDNDPNRRANRDKRPSLF
jgi:low affinity Fe/Cu permease